MLNCTPLLAFPFIVHSPLDPTYHLFVDFRIQNSQKSPHSLFQKIKEWVPIKVWGLWSIYLYEMIAPLSGHGSQGLSAQAPWTIPSDCREKKRKRERERERKRERERERQRGRERERERVAFIFSGPVAPASACQLRWPAYTKCHKRFVLVKKVSHIAWTTVKHGMPNTDNLVFTIDLRKKVSSRSCGFPLVLP